MMVMSVMDKMNDVDVDAGVDAGVDAQIEPCRWKSMPLSHDMKRLDLAEARAN